MSAEKIEAAVKKLVARVGRANVTRRMLAEEAKVSEPSISYHAGGGADALKKYVTKHSKGVVEPSKEKLAKITETLRVKQKPGPKAGAVKKAKKVSKSAVTGKIVSKAHAKANPKTTYTATVKAAVKKIAKGPLKPKPVAKGERKKPVAKGEAVAKVQAKAVRAPLPPPPAPVAE